MSNLTALIIWGIGCAVIVAVGIYSYRDSKGLHKKWGED